MMSANLVIRPSSSAEQAEFEPTPPCAQFVVKTPPSARRYDGRIIPDSEEGESGMSSPPELVLRTNGALKSGSGAESVPKGAIVGYRSVSGLVKERKLNVSTEVVVKQNNATPVKVAAKPRRRKINAEEERDETIVKKTDKNGVSGIEKEEKKPKRKAKAETSTVPKKQRKAPKEKPSGVQKVSKAVNHNGSGNDTKSDIASKKRKRKPAESVGAVVEQNAKPVVGGDGVAKVKKTDRKPKKKTGTTSSHFDSEISGASNEEAQSLPKSPGVPTVQAAKRRVDWTPPTKESVVSYDPDLDDAVSVVTSPITGPDTSKVSFSLFVEEFGYRKRTPSIASTSPERDKESTTGLNKRRKIELIAEPTPGLSRPPEVISVEISPQRKSPKKRGFTITSLVTEKYRISKPKPTSTEKTSSFFAVTNKSSAGSEVTAAAPKDAQQAKKPRAPRATRKKADNPDKDFAKPRKPVTAKAKKMAFVKPQLLSPSGAAKKLDRQDLCFGTSSQLAIEGSVKELQQLQQAIHESRADCLATEETSAPSVLASRFSRVNARSGGSLWAEAGTSGKDEDFTMSETVMPLLSTEEAIESPSAPATKDETLDQPINTSNDLESHTVTNVQDAWDDIDDSCFNHVPNHVPSTTMNQVTLGKRTDDMTQEQLPTIEDLPRVSAHEYALPAQLRHTSSTAGGFVIEPERPAFQSHTSSPLIVPAFLETRKRDSMSLPPLQTDRTALRPLSTNARDRASTQEPSPKKCSKSIVSKKSTTSRAKLKGKAPVEQGPLPEKKPRGRPRKAKTADESNTTEATALSSTLTATHTKAAANGDLSQQWTHIDEIEDSDPDLTPSPPRRKGRPKKMAVIPLPEFVSSEAVSKRVNTVMASAKHPEWVGVQSILFPQITAAVKSLAPSTDPTKPNWFEKMALYDPIVIEDLTAWLNKERNLRIAVGKKEEKVLGWMVQKWCEEKSVCCLWREGLRGGVTTKY